MLQAYSTYKCRRTENKDEMPGIFKANAIFDSNRLPQKAGKIRPAFSRKSGSEPMRNRKGEKEYIKEDGRL